MGVLTVFLDRVENLKDSDGIIAGKTGECNSDQHVPFISSCGAERSGLTNPVFAEAYRKWIVLTSLFLAAVRSLCQIQFGAGQPRI